MLPGDGTVVPHNVSSGRHDYNGEGGEGEGEGGCSGFTKRKRCRDGKPTEAREREREQGGGGRRDGCERVQGKRIRNGKLGINSGGDDGVRGCAEYFV